MLCNFLLLVDWDCDNTFGRRPGPISNTTAEGACADTMRVLAGCCVGRRALEARRLTFCVCATGPGYQWRVREHVWD